MQSNQITNSDLLALLSGSPSKSASSADGVLGEFSQLLEAQGSLDGLSPDDLINFFKKGQGSQTDLDELMSKLQSNEGKELLKSLDFENGIFTNAEGESIDPKSLLQKLNLNESITDSLTKSDLNTDSLTSKESLNKYSSKFENSEKFTLENNASKKADPNKLDIKTGEDFMAQRNALMKKTHVQMDGDSPVLKSLNPGVSQYRKESIVTDQRIIKSSPADGLEPKVESSSEFQMNEIFEGSGENQFEVQTVQASKNSKGFDSQFSTKVQVVDISQISAENKTELINKVGNYIEQAYVAGQDSVEMVIKHDELGHFRVAATRTGAGQQIDLEINAMNREGHQFFVDNESELIKNLTQSGVKLSHVKITANNEFFALSEGRSQMSDNNSHGQGSSDSSSQSQHNNRGQGQEGSGQDRRRQLWKNAQEYQQNFQAA